MESIRHRGPDQNGVWSSNRISLGAVRLKIIDLSGGDQPIVSDDGKSVIVFNGEVYNHAELRTELESLGHRFHSRCDTEVVLKAFLEWDLASFQRLRGMFAFAIWQERERRLVLVRDRLGIKPLYVYQREDDIHFGSELKTLFAHPDVERKLDIHALGYYLSLNWVPTPYTLVSGISKLKAGHFLEWREGTIRNENYWNLHFWPEKRYTLDSAKEELDHLLRLSLKEHLLSDVPLGVWASGGLDSSTVLHYAAEQVPRLKTFSVSFRGAGHDESQWFREAAAQYGTDHHEFDLNPEGNLPAAIEKLVEHCDEPSADAGALPVWYLSEMSRRQVTVALSGEGADELFGGYATYLADLKWHDAQRVPRWVRSSALAGARLWPASDAKIGFDYKLTRFLSGSLLEAPEAHLYWTGTFGDAEKRRLLRAGLLPARDGDIRDLWRSMPAEAGATGPVNRFLWVDQRYYLADDILTKCDRMSMAHSLEVRPPFLDHRIVEFAARLPESLKIQGDTLKFVLRELMRDKLPSSILTRKKEGFDIPAHQWFRSALRPMLADAVNERTVRESGLFEWHEIERVIQRHQARRGNWGYHLWGLLILFLWMRKWNIQTGATN